MMKYPRTTSSTSSGFFEDDEPMMDLAYQASPHSTAHSTPEVLKRHMVRMFSTEDASGTSAVAIDNKIEQAMDLVKSHLMIAVREEVEVLKEKISELMDKINQLEVENTILKSNMSQEMLQQLQMQTQLQIAGSNTNSNSSSTGTPAITAGNSNATVSTNNMIAAAPQQQQQQQQAGTPTTAAANESTDVSPAIETTTTAAAAAAATNNGAENTAATTNGPLSSS